MSIEPDLLYSATEEDLRASVRSLLDKSADWSAVLARFETDVPYDLELWNRLARDIGVAGLAVPESVGGAGATWRETAVVAEELGRSVAPVPFLGSAVLATAALLAAREQELLPRLAAGEAIGALAVSLATAVGAPFPRMISADGEALSGTITHVADAGVAGHLVVPAVDSDGPALYVVDSATTHTTPRISLDLTRRLYDLRLEDSPGRRIASGSAAQEALNAALSAGSAILASEQLGVAEQAMAITIEHLRSRYQFGRPLGSFQGLKHRMADVWVEIVQARAVARYAADCLATDAEDLPVAIAVAGAHCGDVAVHATEEAVQLHGGLGFSWENFPHLLLKRAKSDQISLGTPDRHRARLAGLVDLPGA